MTSPAPRLVELGSLAIDAAQLGADPVWLAAGRLAVTTAADTLTFVRLEAGLPEVARTAFPAGMRLPSDPWDNFDLNYDRPGIHGLAFRPDGEAFAIGGVTDDHDRVVHVFGLDGKVLAEATALDAAAFDVPEDFMLCPIALAWGGAGTLFLCCSIENEHHIATLDPAKRLAVIGLLNLGGGFPEPAAIFPFAHPTADAAAFLIACGQDGVWLRAVEHGAGGLARVETDIDEDASTTSLCGYAPDGRIVHSEQLAIEGTCQGGVVLGDRAAVVVGPADLDFAEWARVARQLVLYGLGDGAVVGRVDFPVGHHLVAGQGDCIVTREGDRVTAWRVEP